ncbi:MAG: PKD domain-containing protein [Bryobacteraceae bacterium]
MAGLLAVSQFAAAQASFTEDKWSLSPFFGLTAHDEVHGGPGYDLANRPTFGVRVGEDLWRKFGFEQTLAWNPTKLQFLGPVKGVTQPDYGARNFRLSFDGLYHFTERGSRLRPFIAAGIGTARFNLTGGAQDLIRANLPPTIPDAQALLQYNYGGGLKYRLTNRLGLRVDARGLSSHAPTYGLATFGNPGGAFLLADRRLNSAEITGGVMFHFGGAPAATAGQPAPRKISKDFSVLSVTQDPPAAGVESQGILINRPVTYKATVQNPKNRKLKYQWYVDGKPMGTDSDTFVYTPTQPGPYRVQVDVTEAGKDNPAFANTPNVPSVYAKAPPPPPAPEHRVTVTSITADPASSIVGVPGAAQGSLTGLNATNSIAAGSPVRLTATSTDTLNHTLTYNWLVNGTQVGSGNPFTYTPATPGWYRAELRVVDPSANGVTPTVPAPLTIYARDTRPPTATCSVSNATLTAGQSTNLSVAATVAQGNTARILWTLSEGSVANTTAAQTAFNSSTVNFPTNPQVQTKTITATARVTDDNGATANCNTTIRVSTDPQAVHYGDILFSQGSARVDNAAKRVLLERLYPELTGAYQGYTLVLVGHTDARERARNLDRNRVRNTAAVVTANTRSCAALEPSRIKADWIGATESEYKDASGLADTRGSSINRNDPRSQNRRVELWLVPAGKPVPSVVKESRTLETKDLKPLGCPR